MEFSICSRSRLMTNYFGNTQTVLISTKCICLLIYTSICRTTPDLCGVTTCQRLNIEMLYQRSILSIVEILF